MDPKDIAMAEEYNKFMNAENKATRSVYHSYIKEIMDDFGWDDISMTKDGIIRCKLETHNDVINVNFIPNEINFLILNSIAENIDMNNEEEILYAGDIMENICYYDLFSGANREDKFEILKDFFDSGLTVSGVGVAIKDKITAAGWKNMLDVFKVAKENRLEEER